MFENIKKNLVNYFGINKGDRSYKELFARSLKNLQVELSQELSDFVYILFGVLSASFGLRGILMPNSFIDGGVTGISLMLNSLTGISLSFSLIVINLPFIVLAYFSIGKRFR